MRYTSTRDSGISLSPSEVIVKGLSQDGGLYVPAEFPAVEADELSAFLGLSYPELAAKIMGMYLTDFDEVELLAATEAAYGGGKFSYCPPPDEGPPVIGGWERDPAPVLKLGEGIYSCELWHGPTSAFKDVALQILPRILTSALKKTGENRTVAILTATSGDTGKAALEGFAGVPGTRIVVFYPDGGVSAAQRLQMVTQDGENVSVCAVKGNFDDTQTGVKEIFSDAGFSEMLSESGFVLSSANSINFGRLLPQIVYYFRSYLKLVSAGEIALLEDLNFVVPTGNFGNILAGYYAYRMGLPVGRLICASNKNNVLTDFIETGEYDRNREFYSTSSPSMDILVSSNLERLLFDLSDGDSKSVSAMMAALSSSGKYRVANGVHQRLVDRFGYGFCGEEGTLRAISEVYEKYGYVCDPHTAVGFSVWSDYAAQSGDGRKTVVMSTASPVKFAADVLRGLGENPPDDPFVAIEMLSARYPVAVPDPIAELREKGIRFDAVVERPDMRRVVADALGVDM